jgi:hypothetical protein
MPVTVSEWSKVCTVFARSEAGIMGSNPNTRHECLVCVYVYPAFVFFVQVEALRRPDGSSNESYRLLNDHETEN